MIGLRYGFGRLQWKLTWNYTWVAALSFFVVQTLLFLGFAVLLGLNPFRPNSGLLMEELFPAIIADFEAITTAHLRATSPDTAALQTDLEHFTAGDVPPVSTTKPFGNFYFYSIFVLDIEQHLLASVPKYSMLPPDGRLFEASALFPDDAFGKIVADAYTGVASSQYVSASMIERYLVVGTPIYTEDGKLLGVQLGVSMAPPSWFYLTLAALIVFSALLLFTPAAAVVGSLFGWRTARRLSDRLTHLADTAAAWGRADFTHHIKDDVPDEIGDLGHSLNHVAQELEQLLADNAQIAVLTERNRVARELHDTLAQGVAGLILQLEAVKHHLHAGDVTASQQIVNTVTNEARKALGTTRAAIEDLRGDALSDLEFVTYIEQQVAQLCKRYDLPFQVSSSLSDGLQIPATIIHHTQRTLVELLTNVIRHARATQVEIVLTASHQSLSLEVIDDGSGFDTSQPLPPGHYGMVGIIERARLIGGDFEISSSLSSGTAAQLTLPLENQI